jgi:hypothetical protein
MPTVDTKSPSSAIIRPFMMFSPASPIAAHIPNTPNAKNSGDPKARATVANKGANMRRAIALRKDPPTLPISDNFRASPACPLCAIGYPSKIVIMAEGWPGVLRRIAGIAAPNVDPTYVPSKRYNPGRDSIPKVNGSNIAKAVGAFNPGKAPMTTPANMPTFIIKIFCKVKIVLKIPTQSINGPPNNLKFQGKLHQRNYGIETPVSETDINMG